MFKKSERLTKAEFESYFSTGKRHHSKVATIITAPADKRRVAVVVGKKVYKSAVKRNLLRRRVYALLRPELEAVSYTGVLIVLVKKPLASLSRKEAAAALRTVIAEALKTA